MKITELLQGNVVEDVRRENDGSVSLHTDKGKVVSLYVNKKGLIDVKSPKISFEEWKNVVAVKSERMNLREAFLGFEVNFVTRNDNGGLTFEMCALKGKEKYSKQSGHRRVVLSSTDGIIDELPPVSAIVSLPSLGIVGAKGNF